MDARRISRRRRYGALFVAVGLVAAACSAPTPSCSGTPTASPTDGPARAERTDGSFRLVLELPRTTWRAGETIDARATLSLVGVSEAKVSGSGSGLISFLVANASGKTYGSWAQTPCHPWLLIDPVSTQLTDRPWLPGGGATPPRGDWTVTAIVEPYEGYGSCGANKRLLQAGVDVHVVD